MLDSVKLNDFLKLDIPLFEKEVSNNTGNCGLYDGLMGQAITYFLLGKHAENPSFFEKGHQLLDKVGDHIDSVEMLDYANGIAGIGWGVEWLKQNGFIDVNTDEILEDIDDTLYKAVVFAPGEDISLEKGTLSKAVYFLKRYQSINPGTHRFKTICHQECLVILTDELREKTDMENPPFIKVDSNSPYEVVKIAQALLFLTEIWPHKINLATVEDTLYHLAESADNFLKKALIPVQLSDFTNQYLTALQYLVFAFYMAGMRTPCSLWREHAKQYLDILQNHSARKAVCDSGQFAMYSILNAADKELGKELPVAFCNTNPTFSDGFLNNMPGSLLAILASLSPQLVKWHDILHPYLHVPQKEKKNMVTAG